MTNNTDTTGLPWQTHHFDGEPRTEEWVIHILKPVPASTIALPLPEGLIPKGARP